MQTIETFRLIQTDESDVIGAEAPRQILSTSEMQRETANPENRLFLIFLDDYHTRAANAVRIRQSLARFVNGLTSHDLVALLYPLNTVAATTFSRDHEGTAAAIMQFQGRKYNYQATTPYEKGYEQLPPEVQEQIRNDITVRTLQSACALMATLRDGRKTVLFVSEGLAGNFPAGAMTTGTMFPPTLPTQTQSQQQLSQEFFNSVDQMARLRDVFTAASRGNTSIYTLDPRGLAPSEFGAGDQVGADIDRRVLNEAIDSLRTLADQTGGRAITGRNDPLPDLKKMVHELSAYYLLGYTSTIAPRDGKFHEIQVRVNRRDVDVKARKGYWAYSEDEIRRASEPPKPGPPEEVAQALDTLAGVVEPSSRRSVALWLGMARGDAERAQVTLVWEATPSMPDTRDDRIEQISVTATSADGGVVFSGSVPRDSNAVTPAGRVTFAAPAGPLRVRVASENAAGQKLDTEDLNELVPDFTSTGAVLTDSAGVSRANRPRRRRAARHAHRDAGGGAPVLADRTPSAALRRVRARRHHTPGFVAVVEPRGRIPGNPARAGRHDRQHVRSGDRPRVPPARRLPHRNCRRLCHGPGREAARDQGDRVGSQVLRFVGFSGSPVPQFSSFPSSPRASIRRHGMADVAVGADSDAARGASSFTGRVLELLRCSPVERRHEGEAAGDGD